MQRQISRWIVVTCLVGLTGALSAQKFEGLAGRPPMGWNTWNIFQTNINERIIMDMADIMVSSGMKEAGYTYLVLDDGWMSMQRDSLGNLVPDPVKFPHGMRYLSDYIHSKGLKFGMYNCAGTLTCQKYPGTRGYEYQDARNYAAWGTDYLKFDWCNTAGINAKEAYTTMSKALFRAGRPMIFSVCEWGVNRPWEWAPAVGQLWRTTEDIYQVFDSVHNMGGWNALSVMRIADMQDSLRKYAGPGHWNDPDMLEVGNGMTESEDRAHFSLWCMMAAPLMAGNDLRKVSPATLRTLTNRDAIAIDQDELGIQGFKYTDTDSLQTWFKPLSGDEWAICIVNRSSRQVSVGFDWKQRTVYDSLSRRKVDPSVEYTLYDIWQHRNAGTTDRPLKAVLGSHDVLLYRMVPGKGKGSSHAARFKSSDAALQQAYDRAMTMALHYRGDPADPSGPWYEAALPSRNAFCMRDVSHQSIGAEIAGMSGENRNLFSLFAGSISASRDWCGFWEINKWGKPAPEDYRNDSAFWYNLDANFDVLYACWRLYQWTGDSAYITAPVFASFFAHTMREYIAAWQLRPAQLLTRQEHPNAPVLFDPKDPFHTCRGLPSYVEGLPHLLMGVDLVAAVYRACHTYADILRRQGRKSEAEEYIRKAVSYQERLEKDWWDPGDNLYKANYAINGKTRKGEGEAFLLWFDALQDSVRLQRTLAHVIAAGGNVETLSYLPQILYRYGQNDKARSLLLYLTDPATPRREYPEVSFGVLEGIVQGLMGISPDARAREITTLYHGGQEDSVSLEGLSLLGTEVSLMEGAGKAEMANLGSTALNWAPSFWGNYKGIRIGEKVYAARHRRDASGGWVSFVRIAVKPGSTVRAACVDK